MKRRRVIRPEAEREIDEQADYLALHANEEIAHRFLEAFDETVDLLLQMPGVGAPWPSAHIRLHDIRRCAVQGFPNYLIFYRAKDDALEVLHLFHGAEDIERRLEDE